MTSPQVLLVAVRYGLPVLLVVIGIAFLAMGGDMNSGVGLMFVGCAGVVITANVLFRIGASGESEREAEEAARRYFDEHGRWPDEAR